MPDDETVVETEIRPFPGSEMAELYIGVRHADGRKFWRPATLAEIEKLERELTGWKDKLIPGLRPIHEVPGFSSKDFH